MTGATAGDARTANFTTGLVYFIKAFVGPGCLSLPLAFQNCGLGLGLGLLGAMGVIVTYNLRTMVLCKQHVDHKGIRTYADLTEEALGSTARKVVEMLVNGVQLGICAVYFDFFAENAMAMLAKRYQTSANFYFCMLLILPVYSALALLKSIESIAPYAALANALVYAAIGVVLFAAVEEIHAVYFHHRHGPPEENHLEWFQPSRAPLFYSTAVYSFEGVCSLLPVENAMARPKEDMLPVTYCGMAVVTFTYAAVGAIAYAAWPDVESGSITAEVNNNATNGYWYAAALAANIATVIAVVLTFPVQMFPSIELLERTFGFVGPKTSALTKSATPNNKVSRRHRPWQRGKVLYEPVGLDDDTPEMTHDTAISGHVELPEINGKDLVVVATTNGENGTQSPPKQAASRVEDPESCPEKEDLLQVALQEDDEDDTRVRRRAASSEPPHPSVDLEVALAQPAAPSEPGWPMKRILFRIAVVFVVGLVAALVPDLGDLIALIGALTGSALSLVVPSLIDLYCPRPNRKKWEVPCDILIISIGVIGGIAGTIQAVFNVIDGYHDDDSVASDLADAVDISPGDRRW